MATPPEATIEEGEFLLQERPVVEPDARSEDEPARESFDDLGELPRSYGVPLLVAIARDPHTLFAYWDVDWNATFGDSPPADRTVQLRVFSAAGGDNLMITIEPLAGSCYVSVAEADADYQLQLGYYQPANVWNSVATSEPVITPRDRVPESSDFQLVTVPLHLHFQQLVETFRGSRFDGQALSDSIAALQSRVESADDSQPLGAQQRELAETIQAIVGTAGERQNDGSFNFAADDRATAARIERILGIAATSPANGFGNGGS